MTWHGLSFLLKYTCRDSHKVTWYCKIAEIWQTSWICIGIIGIKEFSRVQVRFLMLNTMCLTSLHNNQQDLINFIPVFSSLLMQVIFFLLLKHSVPNSDMRYFCASLIYKYTNPMVMYKLMRIRHIWSRHKFCKCGLWPPIVTLKQGFQNHCFACCLNEVYAGKTGGLVGMDLYINKYSYLK